MIVEGIELLGEEDFTERMLTENASWREACVKEGDIRGFGGLPLHYYYALRENARGNIVIIHGFCEFWTKYHEMAWYYWQLGYSVFFLEQRGHGRSGRQVAEEDMVYVSSFDEYVEDQKRFIDQVVIPNGCGKTLLMYSHSMGGAVGALFLEKYPRYFRAAVLSSPMLKFNRRGIPEPALRVFYRHVKLHHMGKTLSVGQSRFTGIPDFEHSSELSPARFYYQYQARLDDPKNRMSAACFAWTCAGLDMEPVVLKNASRIRVPVIMFQAGRDHLVEPSAQDAFAKRAGHLEFVRYEKSKHEMFNADDEVRFDYYGRVFRFFDDHA